MAPAPRQDERVAVCSIEKANVAVNRMLAEGRLGELAAVVVDEVHMVTDPHRWAGRISSHSHTQWEGGCAGGRARLDEVHMVTDPHGRAWGGGG
jgi:hypothetical protein